MPQANCASLGMELNIFSHECTFVYTYTRIHKRLNSLHGRAIVEEVKILSAWQSHQAGAGKYNNRYTHAKIAHALKPKGFFFLHIGTRELSTKNYIFILYIKVQLFCLIYDEIKHKIIQHIHLTIFHFNLPETIKIFHKNIILLYFIFFYDKVER